MLDRVSPNVIPNPILINANDTVLGPRYITRSNEQENNFSTIQEDGVTLTEC